MHLQLLSRSGTCADQALHVPVVYVSPPFPVLQQEAHRPCQSYLSLVSIFLGCGASDSYLPNWFNFQPD